MTSFRYGYLKERQVGEFLERRRFVWAISAGSRGPFDLLAESGLLKLAIQVKATRLLAIHSSRLSSNGLERLLEAAKEIGAIPALALVTRNYVVILNLIDGTILFQGDLKPLRYTYIKKKKKR